MKEKNLAVVFPGQGSQQRGMGRDLAERDHNIMELWKLAEKLSGLELREVYWEGDEEEMVRTHYQQPALCVVGISIWQLLRPSPLCLAGHSVGEYGALVAGGVLSIEDALKIVSLRGKLMYEVGLTHPGSMAAILKLPCNMVEEIVKRVQEKSQGTLCIANYNSPRQFVISGDSHAVEDACNMAREKKGKAIVLPVSGAFHSSLMEEAADELAGYMDKFIWRDSRIPIFFNVTATKELAGERIKEIMKRQMISSVLWNQIIENQWREGVRLWWELGPKGVLCGLIRRILAGKGEEWGARCIEGIEHILEICRGNK